MAVRAPTVLWTLAALGLAGMIVYEFTRPRPPLADPVRTKPPASRSELARLEGGFAWSKSRGGTRLFDLLADSGLSEEGGVNFVRNVKEFTLFTADGRPVLVRAQRGRIRQKGDLEAADFEGSLEGSVFVRTPDGLEFATESVAFDTSNRQLTAPGPATLTGPHLVARLAGFVYTPDDRVVQANGPLQVELGRGAVWTIDAGRALYRITTGELVLETPYRAAQGGDVLVAGPGRLSLPKAPATASMTSDGPALLSGRSGDFDWRLAASRLQVDGIVRDAGPAVPQIVVAGPPASLVFTRGGGAPGSGRAEAEGWRLEAGPTGAFTRGVAGPGFVVHWSGADAEGGWTVRGEWLEAERDAAGGLLRALARGLVKIAGPSGTAAEGALLAWEASDPERIVLTGEKARARRGGDLVEAPRLIVLRDRRVIIAEDGPLSEAASLKRGEGALFRGDEPVRVRSSRATLSDGEGPIEFEGPVHAWQQDTNLRAGNMKVLRAESRLLAEGDVTVTAPLGAPGTRERRRVRLSTQNLDYDGSARVALLRRGALYEEPGVRVEAEQMDVRLARDGGVDELTAIGRVRILADGNDGRGDRLEWRGGSGGTVLLIGERALATLESPGQAASKSSRIRYELGSRRVSLEGGGGRTVIEGRPPAQKPDDGSDR